MTPNQRRKIDLAKIHIGKNQLGMDEETYRSMLWTIGRVHSSADLDFAGRMAVLQHLKARGFKATRRPVNGQAGLVYHIWNRMALAGVVQQKGLSAWLLANTRHINGVGFQTPQFCSPKALNQVIEQLKAWATREGVNWK